MRLDTLGVIMPPVIDLGVDVALLSIVFCRGRNSRHPLSWLTTG
jgi:hypothetical protein